MQDMSFKGEVRKFYGRIQTKIFEIWNFWIPALRAYDARNWAVKDLNHDIYAASVSFYDAIKRYWLIIDRSRLRSLTI